MTDADVLAVDAFFDLLDDAEFDAQLLLATEEFFDINMRDLDWMLP
ncbi:hypothetical protein ACWGDX_32650 [Streptomyces sp. NPDC055025]